jgi:helix-turn-helix protein
MSEGVVADFPGRFLTEEMETQEPVNGRILLSEKQLVLATEEAKTRVPLSAVVDTNVGSPPPAFQQFFNDTVTIQYKKNGDRQAAIIEATGKNVEKFKTVFFKTAVGGQTVIVTHPAKRGGRITDASDRKMKLKLKRGQLDLKGKEETVTIDLGGVIDFGREQRDIGGKTRPTLSVDHSEAGTTLTTLITLPNSRKLNLLGRFVRLEYSEIMEDLEEIDVGEEEVETLVSLYSAGGSAELSMLVTGDINETRAIVDQLQEKELVEDNEDGLALTPKGQVIVNEKIESVNA